MKYFWAKMPSFDHLTINLKNLVSDPLPTFQGRCKIRFCYNLNGTIHLSLVTEPATEEKLIQINQLCV